MAAGIPSPSSPEPGAGLKEAWSEIKREETQSPERVGAGGRLEPVGQGPGPKAGVGGEMGGARR